MNGSSFTNETSKESKMSPFLGENILSFDKKSTKQAPAQTKLEKINVDVEQLQQKASLIETENGSNKSDPDNLGPTLIEQSRIALKHVFLLNVTSNCKN